MKKSKYIFSRLILGVLLLSIISPINVSIASSADANSDWTNVDWDEQISLAEDYETYYDEINQLIEEGRDDEIGNVVLNERNVRDPEVLSYFNAPIDARIEARAEEEEDAVEDEILAKEDKSLIYENPKNIITDKDVEFLKIKKVNEVKSPIGMKPEVKVKKQIDRRLRSKLFKATLEGFLKQSEKLTFTKLSSLFPTAYANYANPLMEYYTGIESNVMDNGLYYVGSIQNADGSFGYYNRYELTAEIALLITSFNQSNNDQFDAAVQYLINTAPKNNREKAIKARLMFGLGEPYQVYLDELIAIQNPDGGFGLYDHYQSDTLTTLEMAMALGVSGYHTSDILPASLYYVVNKIDPNGAMYATEISEPSYYLVNKTARDLYPFKDLSVGPSGSAIAIQDKIDDLIDFLTASYDSSTELLYGSNDLIDYAMTMYTFNLHDIESELKKIVQYDLEIQQSLDGRFDISDYANVESMRALAQSELVITDISPTSILENRTAASFDVTIENHGYATSKHAYIYTFIDNFDIESPVDLYANNVRIAPGGTAVVNITYPETTTFIEDTEIKLYIEGNESDYSNNWFAQTFNFASNGNLPALPTYFIANHHVLGGLQGVNVRWPNKVDPNRVNYVIGMREAGSSDWGYVGIYDHWNGVFWASSGFEEGKTYEFTAGVLHSNLQEVTMFSDYNKVIISADEQMYDGVVSGYVTQDNDLAGNAGIYAYGRSGDSFLDGSFEISDFPNGSSAAWADGDQYDHLIKKFYVAPGQTTEGLRVKTRLLSDTTPPTIDQFEIRFADSYIVMNQHEADIFIVGSDNIGIKEADIYYMDPNDSIWVYLGTESFNGSVAEVFPWYIEDTMLGSGYQIKAILRDYQGNESTEAIWGPFEIIDGSTPAFEVLSPNGGENWVLGNTETASWIAQSVNGISEVSVWLSYNDHAYVQDIAYNTVNTGSYDHEVRNISTFASDEVKIYIDGEDDVTGVEAEDYSDDYFSIVDNNPVPEAPWEDPYLITKDFDYLPAGGNMKKPMIQYDANGLAHIVYQYVHETHGSGENTITQQLYYSTLDPDVGVPSVPVKINESTQSKSGNYTMMSDVSMDLDSNGYPHLVWSQYTAGLGFEGLNTHEIFYMYFDGAVWSAPTNISLNTTNSAPAVIDIGSSDNIHVAWRDGYTYDSSGAHTGVSYISYQSKPLGGAWSSVETLASGESPGSPIMKVTNNGIVHILYNQTDPVTALNYIYKNGGWSVPSTLTTEITYTKRIVEGINNSLHLISHRYISSPASLKIMYQYYDGNNWMADEIVFDDTEFVVADPKIAVDENNVPYVIYEAYEDGMPKDYLYWTAKVNGSWSAPEIIHRISQSVSASDLVYSGDGILTAIWLINYSFKDHIMVNHASTVGINTVPTIQILEPNGGDDIADENYTITWIDDDQDHNAMINFYYDTDNSGQDGLSVNLATIFEDDSVDEYAWDTSGVAEGDYYIYAVMNNEEDDPVVVYSDDIVTVKHHVMYEDAENQNVEGWEIVDNVPAGAQILNVVDSEHGGRVIEFDGALDLGNSYKLLLEDGNEWNNTEYFFIQWDQKFSEDYEIYIGVETTIGDRFMKYTPTDDSLGVNGTVIHNGLGHKADNGTWITFARDLQTHFHKIYPGANILAVNSFKVVGNGRVDNIKLLREMPDGYSNDNLFEMIQPNFAIPDLWPLGIDKDKLPTPDMLNF